METRAIKKTAALAACACLVFCAAARAQELKRLDAAAGTISKELRKAPGLAGAVAVAPFRSPDGSISELGGLLAERLTGLLLKNRAVNVLDRRYLARVLGETRLRLSGVTEQKDSAEVGKFTGARFLLLGAFAPLEGGRLAIDARLVETATGRVAAAARAELRLDGALGALYGRVSEADTRAEKFFDYGASGPAGKGGLRVELLLNQEHFKPGQAARAVVTVSSAAEVYLYSADAEGRAALLFPAPGESGLLLAGRPLLFPSEAAEKAGTALEAALPPGADSSAETLRAFAVAPGRGGLLAGASTYSEITGRLEASGLDWAEAARAFTIGR